jgi:hypothetical protein
VVGHAVTVTAANTEGATRIGDLAV